ncbi:MAG: nucleolar RNA-binding Nop10p family protein [Candidatus Anstonellales archaeon]
MKYIRKCMVCRQYTLSEMHCGKRTESAHPPPFKPSDRYARYRRMERGLE